MTVSPASRRAYVLIGAVLAGCISATIYAIALNHAQSLLFFIIYLTAIPLFVAGLGAGPLAGLLASTAGFINLLIQEPSNHAVLYAIVYAIPIPLLVILSLRHRVGADEKTYWYPEGFLLIAAVLYPCILYVIMSALSMNHDGGLLALTHEYIDASAASLQGKLHADETAQLVSFYHAIARYLPALFGIGWTFMTLLSMVIGQNALQKHKMNLRTPFTLDDLHVPGWLVNAVAILGLADVLTKDPYAYTGLNLAMMLGVPFLFVGIAIAHAWARTKSATTVILVVFYLMLAFMPFLALLVVLLGVVDQWANFRQRFTKQPETT